MQSHVAPQGRIITEFFFNLEPLPGSPFGEDGTDDAFCRFKRDFFANLDVRMADKFWTSLAVDHPRLKEVADGLESLMGEGIARPMRGSLSTRLEDDAARPLEWFVVSPRTNFPSDGWPRSTVRACNVAAGVHLAGTAWACYGSERLRAVVEATPLTGVDFIWIQDKGRYRAPQWFRMLPSAFMGRGLDHPGFDFHKYQQHVRSGANVYRPDAATLALLEPSERKRVEEKTEEAIAKARATDFSNWRRLACRQFAFQFAKSDWSIGNEAADRIARMFPVFGPLDQLTVVSFPTLLREYLPKTDFGFISYENGPDARDGADGSRSVCLNRRAYETLLGEGVIRAGDCYGILVQDNPPRGALGLDRAAWPHPQPDRDMLAEQVRKADKALAAFRLEPKPVRAATLKRSLTLLRAARSVDAKRFGKRGSAKKLDSLRDSVGVTVPSAWEQVLKTANGFEWAGQDGHTVTALSMVDLPAWHASAGRTIADLDLNEGPQVLHIGHFDDGDMLALHLGALERSGECPVLRISHETHATEREWPTVAAFLEELFS